MVSRKKVFEGALRLSVEKLEAAHFGTYLFGIPVHFHPIETTHVEATHFGFSSFSKQAQANGFVPIDVGISEAPQGSLHTF